MKKLRTFGVMGITLLASSIMLAPLSVRADGDHGHDHVRWRANNHEHQHGFEHDHEHDGDHVHRFDRDRGWDRDRFRRFSDDDWNLWRRGHWVRGHDGDELGWWWVAAGLWFFYPHRVEYPYPYTNQSVVVNNPPAAASSNTSTNPVTPVQYWYYCRASKSYYPYVKSCAGKWEKVPSTPPPPPPN